MKGDKKYLSLTLLLLTILSVLFYNFVHLDKRQEIENLENKIANIHNEIHLIKTFNVNHNDIDSEFLNLSQRHFRAVEAYPPTTEENNILDYLREIAKNNYLEILILNIIKSENTIQNDNEKKYLTSVFNIKVKGDYFHISDFLYDIYNSHKFIDIKRIDLKNDDGVLTLNLEINCYYSRQENNSNLR